MFIDRHFKGKKMRWIRPYSSRRRVPPLCSRHALGSWLAYEMIADTHQKNKQTRTDDGGVFKFGKYATPKVAASSWNISSHPYLFISDFTFNSKILWWSSISLHISICTIFCDRKLQRRWYTVLFNSEWDNSLEFLGYFSYPLLFCVCWLLLRVVTVTDCWQQLRYLTHVFLSRIHMRPSLFFLWSFQGGRLYMALSNAVL